MGSDFKGIKVYAYSGWEAEIFKRDDDKLET